MSTTINSPQVVYPDIPTSTSAYDFGDCTYGVSQIYPSINQYMGNAAQWIDSANQLGYTVTQTPFSGAIVVYGAGGGYSQYGHVAVVTAVDSASTFTVLEMNYVNNDVWDSRVSDMTDVEGFIQPPSQPSTDQVTLTSAITAGNQVTTPCATFSWSILGTNYCMDGAIGIVALGGGLMLMVAGLIITVAFAIGHTSAGKAATDTLDAVGITKLAKSAKANRKPEPVDNEAMARKARLDEIRNREARATARRSRARARLQERTT